tara:strand:+ start:676 stop:891 length:216 start_codon:yes stop_codon:yes gene_type:complete
VAYTETKSKSVKQVYTGQDPKTGFSRYIGSAKSSKGRKASKSAETSIFEDVGIAVSEFYKKAKTAYKDLID